MIYLGSMKTILIIEDEKAMNEKHAEEFRKTGFQVLQAYDGVEGMAVLRREQVDAVLLEVVMPKMDGFEVLRRMKKDVRLKDVPVFIHTHLGHPDDIKAGKDLGAQEVLLKGTLEPAGIAKRFQTLFTK